MAYNAIPDCVREVFYYIVNLDFRCMPIILVPHNFYGVYIQGPNSTALQHHSTTSHMPKWQPHQVKFCSFGEVELLIWRRWLWWCCVFWARVEWGWHTSKCSAVLSYTQCTCDSMRNNAQSFQRVLSLSGIWVNMILSGTNVLSRTRSIL